MKELFLRLIGHKLTHQALARHTTNGGALDLQLGFTLFRDRRVPVASKLLALSAGLGFIVLMAVMELPLDAVMAMFMPLLLVADTALDGLGALVGPVVIASLLLPRLAPAPIVQTIRAERTGYLAPLPISG